MKRHVGWLRPKMLLCALTVFAVFGFFNLLWLEASKLKDGLKSDVQEIWKRQKFSFDSIKTEFQLLAKDFFVYAAYLDKIDVIKIIAMRKDDFERNASADEQIWCSDLNWETNFDNNAKVKGEIYRVKEKRRSTYFVPLIITCDFRRLENRKQGFFSKKSNSDSFKLITIQKSIILKLRSPKQHDATPTYALAKCVPIFYGTIDIDFLLKILEVNSKYGVNHFQFYVHPALFSSLVEALRNSSQNISASVSIKLWRLPVNPLEIWYYGQLVMLQDCLYNLRSNAKYLLVADLDEYLMPRQKFEFGSQAREVSCWNFATVDTECCLRNNRTNDWKPNRKLAKYAVRPLAVRSLGVHKVDSYEEDGKLIYSRNVSSTKAVVVHCRRRC